MNPFLRIFISLVFIASFMGLTIPAQAKDIYKQYEIPFFKNEPPASLHYKVLGVVHAKYKGDSFLTSNEDIFKSTAKELVAKAKHIGANAIIHCKFTRLGENIYMVEGDAILISQ